MTNRTLLAGQSTPVVESLNGLPVGFQQIVGLAAATQLTIPAGAIYALIGCSTQNVNWRDDGGAPTAALGMPIIAGAAPIKLTNLDKLEFIQQAANAVLNASFYR
jgi:hypothetical protein